MKLLSLFKKDTRNNTMAPKKAYNIWLSKYLCQGGTPTHFYGYEFTRNKEFIVTENDCNTGYRCGANSIHVISLNGSNIQVDGHCHGYIITKEGMAIEVNNTFPWIPLYDDYEYIGEKVHHVTKITPIDIDEINSIIYFKGLNKEEIVKLIEKIYENYVSKKYNNYNNFPEIIRNNIMSSDKLYNNYLDFLIENFNNKFGNIEYYAGKYIKKEDGGLRFNLSYELSRLSIEEKIMLICKLSLENGMNI